LVISKLFRGHHATSELRVCAWTICALGFKNVKVRVQGRPRIYTLGPDIT
jgi:hypothetical protein